jgi:hypothetical protein
VVVEPTGSEHAMFSGRLIEQAALHGMLVRIRDQALALLGVRHLDE